MAELTGADFKSFLLVLVALLGIAATSLGIIKQIKDLRKPKSDSSNNFAHWKMQVETKLDRDNRRLEALEGGNRALCQGMLALLNHEITGNSVEKLQRAQTEINTYLINK